MTSHRRVAFYTGCLQAARAVTGTLSAVVLTFGKGLDQLDDVLIAHSRYQQTLLHQHRQRTLLMQDTFDEIEALPEADDEGAPA